MTASYLPSVALLPSAARTTTQNSGTLQINPPSAELARGIKVTINITNVAAGPSVTVNILGVDANGVTYTILASAALVAVATTVLTVYPGLTAVANVTATDVLPRNIQVNVVANNANSCTYSLAYDLLP